ncbi:MAG: hypothetical protein WCE21_02680 [Candidatus Babeliales bacterium]
MNQFSFRSCVFSLLFMMLFFLPGCRRYICWGLDVFNTGELIDTDCDTVRHYWRACHIYDQFSPLAHFDVLWLSDEVRVAYARAHAESHSLCDDRYHALRARQLEENNHYITFYVLSAITPYIGSDDLADKHAEWSLSLCIDDVQYRPVFVKEVELSPEYVFFFGRACTRFKRTYQVRFDACDINDELLINSATRSLTVCFNRVDREECVTWCLDAQKRVIRDPLNDPDLLLAPLHFTRK